MTLPHTVKDTAVILGTRNKSSFIKLTLFHLLSGLIHGVTAVYVASGRCVTSDYLSLAMGHSRYVGHCNLLPLQMNC